MQRVNRPATRPSAAAPAHAGEPVRSPVPGSDDSHALASAAISADAAETDRRKAIRRTPQVDRAISAPEMPAVRDAWFPRRWSYLILAMIGVIGVSVLYSRSLPGLLTSILLGSGLLLSMQISRIYDAVENRPRLAKAIGLLVAVVLPLFFFGLGVTVWAQTNGIPWDVALTSLLCLSGIATSYLRRQPAAIFAAQFAIWTAAVFAYSSIAGIIGLSIGSVVAVLVCREQIIEQREEREHREAQDRVQTRARDILADYEETGQGWFWETDRRSLLTYVSPPVAKALKRNPDRLIGQPLTRLFDLEDTGNEGERTLMFHLSARSSFSELPVRAAIEKEERWWSVSGRPIFDQFDNFVGFRGSGTDLTERKRSQEQATRLARYDGLTGLANRFQMSQALEKILTAQAEANRNCAVMLLDLDRFKQVNDTMGHPAGDALLQQVAQRLERAVSKIGQVGRLGGDEFKVIVPTKVSQEALSDLAREIIHSISQPYFIEGQRVVIGASVGIAAAPEHGDTSEELIRNADLALYAAKDGGRGRFHFYAQDLHAEAEARAKLEEDLRDAIANGELALNYQPVVSMETYRITGFEALLRWNHPTKGLISPQRFISVAEDSGLIQSIGEWALRQACHDVAQWPDEVRVSVNVSPLQFANPQLPTIVANAISQADVRASRLELEITESVFLGDDDGTDAMFASLKRLGVRLALDDFGTGYSSLGYLKKAPFDKIKIDQSFVRGMTVKDSRNGAIIRSITSLAQSLGMDTTAEGVETLDELDLIRQHGCSHVQGYIFDRPLPFDEVMKKVSGDLTAVASGPKSSRAPRQTILRKVILSHGGHLYNGTVRNLSISGAMVEGLWNVPVDTVFDIKLAEDFSVGCKTIWSVKDRIGVQFDTPLTSDKDGNIEVLHSAAPKHVSADEFRKVG